MSDAEVDTSLALADTNGDDRSILFRRPAAIIGVSSPIPCARDRESNGTGRPGASSLSQADIAF